MLRSIPFLVVLVGCEINEEARVTVEYDQLANFGLWSVGDIAEGAVSGEDGLPRTFAMYRVLGIENTGTAAASFTFVESNVLTVTSAATLNEDPGPSNEALLLVDAWVGSVNVAAGQVQSDPLGLGCFVKEAAGADIAETEGLIDLLHVIRSDQPVTMQRASADGTTVLLDGFQSNQELINLCLQSAPS